MKRWWYIVVTGLILAGLAAAENDGGTESVFSLGAGARAMGMGNGFTALADDATAVYYNPAAISRLSSQQISFLHTILFEGTIYDFISYAYPTADYGGFGAAAMRLGTDDIGRRDNLTSEPADEDLARFSASHFQLILSYSRPVGRRLLTGVNLKLAHQSIDDMSAYGYGFDVSGQYRISENLRAGLLLQDVIGARLKLVNVRERTPFTIRGGLAYHLDLNEKPLSANFAFDLEKPENRSLKVRSGVEVMHNSGFTLRGGYDRDNFTLGMGLKYQNLNFDYAYKFLDELSDSHRFSLTFGFGSTKAEERARRADQLRQRTLELADAQRREALRRELEKADNFYDAGQLDSALAAYYRAGAYAEEDEYIQGRIEAIKQQMMKAQTREPAVYTDSVMVGGPFDFEGQARRLYRQGALIPARDMVRLARQYGSDSESLDSLAANIQTAIDSAVRRSLNRGEKALAEGQFIEAYDAFNTVLSFDPDHSRARQGSREAERGLSIAQHLKLGLRYFEQGRYTDAQGEFNRVLDLEPGNQTAREYLDRIGQRLKESTSLEDLQKDERIWQLYLNGLEAYRQGNYQDAIQYWEEVLESYPNNENTLENIEQARLRLKNQ